LQREEGDAWGTAEALLLLGQVAHEQGDLHRASSCYRESLRLNAERVGDKAILVRGLYSLGYLSLAQEDNVPAARLLGVYTKLREATGSSIRRSILKRDDGQTITVLCENLGKEAFETAWAEGHAMTMEQAVQFALREN
jgi:hypothetical protein